MLHVTISLITGSLNSLRLAPNHQVRETCSKLARKTKRRKLSETNAETIKFVFVPVCFFGFSSENLSNQACQISARCHLKLCKTCLEFYCLSKSLSGEFLLDYQTKQHGSFIHTQRP